MLDTINDNNRQSFMVAEYIFRFIKIGETFTEDFLLNSVGFKSISTVKSLAAAKKGISMALKDHLMKKESGKCNVIIVSDNPRDNIQYKLINNERPITLEKNKTEGYVTINAKYFETENSKDSSYVISPEVVKKIDLLKIVKNPDNPYAISEDAVSSVTKQAKSATDSQRLQMIVNICKMIDEARSDAISVVEFMKD